MVTTLCWWLNYGDSFKMLLEESSWWRLFHCKESANTSNRPPTYPSPTRIKFFNRDLHLEPIFLLHFSTVFKTVDRNRPKLKFKVIFFSGADFDGPVHLQSIFFIICNFLVIRSLMNSLHIKGFKLRTSSF